MRLGHGFVENAADFRPAGDDVLAEVVGCAIQDGLFGGGGLALVARCRQRPSDEAQRGDHRKQSRAAQQPNQPDDSPTLPRKVHWRTVPFVNPAMSFQSNGTNAPSRRIVGHTRWQAWCSVGL